MIERGSDIFFSVDDKRNVVWIGYFGNGITSGEMFWNIVENVTEKRRNNDFRSG